MKVLDLTLPTPAENLACDEALLDESEEGLREELLRFWEPVDYFVVVGSSNRVAQEVNLEVCHAENIPILRRHSGGGAILQGPGCLNYCLILRMDGVFSTVSGTNATLLEHHKRALEPLIGKTVEHKGSSDLAISNIKFSGNSQRRRLRCMMFHGTILHHLDLSLVDRYLRFPSRQPDYRNNRSHLDFIVNINAKAEDLKAALARIWNVEDDTVRLPRERISLLVEQRYGRKEWNHRL